MGEIDAACDFSVDDDYETCKAAARIWKRTQERREMKEETEEKQRDNVDR